ncbi:hypothetical protein [Xenorhabdus hominickii]|uniref:Uncharacterized protein n=1 Tax=Xenorhabdus hominickii TaxID=351679 RepID=A0A2G0Q5V5_XENHO|nr:hypothetical protein [Xenorhabdus hominickii]AOM39634.1 hypothetical protein A9255_02915 [Xenorhabdus hominickii]PHM54582.1 hypothetical protein Xhom_02525 [Xenorhabdus hominickii]
MRNDKIECAKRKCKHIHYENERVMIPDPEFPTFAFIHVCPKCGADDFYIIEELRKNNND